MLNLTLHHHANHVQWRSTTVNVDLVSITCLGRTLVA